MFKHNLHFYIAIPLLFCACFVHADIQKLHLNNGHIQAEITPDIGGRLLSFSLVGKSNFLRVGEAVITNPNPIVTPESDNVGYLGHEIWVGPQSQWWSQQNVNTKRAAEKSVWPPDPYLILAKNIIIAKTEQKVVLQSPSSSVSGLQLTKTYSLLDTRKNSLQLGVIAKNIRTDSVAWDIWFNTRTYANTQIYIPVAAEQDIRVSNLEDKVSGPLVHSLQNGIFSLDMLAPPVGKKSRKGKIMIQPAQGWMAGFHNEQVFIVQFAHQLQTNIHPEQGQIELYNDYIPSDINDGLLEMEVHAPYKKLEAGETMQAEETWTILEYKGALTREAQLAFLRKHANVLGLSGL